MNKEIKQRLKWIELYEETNNAGLVCRRCGISRPTLRKWYKRYKEKGLDGLQDVSRRPHSSPNTKIDNRIEDWILKLRKDRKLGARRIQNELLREHNFQLSLASIHKVLTKHVFDLIKVKVNITIDSSTVIEVFLKESFPGASLSDEEEQVLRILIENILYLEIESDQEDM